MLHPNPVVSILVPTLRRPHNLHRFMDAVRQTSPLGKYQVVFVLDEDDDDTQRALAGLVGLDLSRFRHNGTYPQKINAAVELTEAPFVLCCGDDVIFKPGWYESAERHFGNKGVIGTNDLTPRTKAQNHATAQIVDRKYIDDPGAAWNEPGHVFHEGYDHNYADDELCRLAQYRDEWVFDSDCVIEHKHPCWGTADNDSVYDKGQSKYRQDRRHYIGRRRLWIRKQKNSRRQ